MSAFDEIAYSVSGLHGRDILLAEFSDVLFYFEDADHEAFYEKLLSIVAQKYFTSSVFCLGGKSNVINASKTKNDIGKPRVFVVDNDFDDILGEIETIEGLVYLDRFSIENYLLSFSALLAVAIDRFSLKTSDAYQKCSDFEDFYKSALQRYEKLTRLFLVARKFRLSIQTTKMPVSEFSNCNSVADILPDDFIFDYKNRIIEQATREADWIAQSETLEHLINSAFEPIAKNTEQNHIQIPHNLCGKHLLGIVMRFVEISTGISFADIGTPSLYMDVMGRIDNFKESMRGVLDKIDETVNRQRHALYGV